MSKQLSKQCRKPSLRVCVVCMNAQPESEFDGDSDVCASCVEVGKIQAKNHLNRVKARALFKEMVAANRPGKIDAPHISEICACVINEIGGMERFAMELVDDYRTARELKPGSATVMKFGEAILRLVKESTALRDSAPDAVNLSDEELAEEMIAMCDKLAKERQSLSADDLFQALLEDASGQKTSADT